MYDMGIDVLRQEALSQIPPGKSHLYLLVASAKMAGVICDSHPYHSKEPSESAELLITQRY